MDLLWASIVRKAILAELDVCTSVQHCGLPGFWGLSPDTSAGMFCFFFFSCAVAQSKLGASSS